MDRWYKVRDVYVMTINIGKNDYTRMSHASREFNGTFPHAATSAIDPLIPPSFSYVYIVAFLIWTWYSSDKSLYIQLYMCIHQPCPMLIISDSQYNLMRIYSRNKKNRLYHVSGIKNMLLFRFV